ncbi:MAG: hypothetical protein Q7T37_00385 [bacterium]|nr:hypothetical protein [bacterium]MDO8742529.1 hypothetical protein [bacterium]
MKRIVHHVERHIENIKGKPHHIRKQVAFTSAAGIALFIGLVWFAYSAQTGVFAIKGSSFADATKSTEGVYANTQTDDSSGLAAAAAAVQDESGAARLNVVDTTPPKPVQLEQTTIPF